MNKFEKLIEYIINDEDQKARDLFHTIVVEKSRDIYESIMDEEQVEEMVHGDQVGNMVDEISAEEAVGETEEEFADAGEEELDGDEEIGGDEGSEEFGHDEEAEEDKIMSIDAKLDELLAKFDEIMGDEGQGEEMPAEEPAPEMGAEEPAMFEADESDEEEEEEEEEEEPKAKKTEESRSNKSTSELMREYVDRIGDIYGGAGDANEGDAVGATGKKTSVNTKPGSVGPGADFGGTAVTSKGGEQNQDGTTPTKASNEYNKGQGEIKSGNVNKPGADAGKSGFKTKEGSYETDGDGQGDPTGKMAGTGKNTPASGDSNPKSPLKQNSGKK